MKTTNMTSVRIPSIEFTTEDRPTGGLLARSVTEIHAKHNYHFQFAHVAMFAPALIRANSKVYIAGVIVDNILGPGSAKDERGGVAYARRGHGRGRIYVPLTEQLIMDFAHAADRTDGTSQSSSIRANEIRHFSLALMDLL